MIESIVRQYRATDNATREHGRDWYRLSERDIRRFARTLPKGMGQSVGAAIFAALSPRAQYIQNWRAAYQIAEARNAGLSEPPRTGLGDARDKAWRIAHGEDPDKVLGGDKVRRFWRALAGDPEAVVIDVWMCRVVGIDQERLNPRLYAHIEASFREAARIVGEAPRDLQAILWFAVRGINPGDPVPGRFHPTQEV